MPAMPRVALHTLGCKLNFAETATLGRQFLDRGFELVEFGTPADVCVINTCTVTEQADRECRQLIRRALRTSARPYVIVTGCYAQLDPERVASIEGVDLVLGTREKFRLFDLARLQGKEVSPRIEVSHPGEGDDFGPAFTSPSAGRTRAYLKIQDGCDYSCSFCTIPLARGASRSQSVDATLAQARILVGQGYREIILTGVNVGDFGRKEGSSLLALVEQLAAVPGLSRLRISSIEPNLLTPALLDYCASSSVLCRHFHIPLQSGCDAVLRAMRRRYTSASYADLIRRIKDRIPDCGIGVDVIVGFPGETDEQFETTRQFLAELPVSYLHVFTYSERPRTPAAAMVGTVDRAARSRRNEILRDLGARKRRAFYEQARGSIATVLTESDVEGSYRFGFTGNFVRVALPAGGLDENEIVPALITGAGDNFCIGQPQEQTENS